MRASGILLHLTSLPSPYGIGTMGKAAFAFVDFLAEARQQFWQVLPLQPTGLGYSPYYALSSFAGNPLLIDLEQLADEGWITPEELAALPAGNDARVDFPAIEAKKMALLRTAYGRFIGMSNRDFLQFVKNEQSWLADYALFQALREKTQLEWPEWELPLRHRDPEALAEARSELKYEIAFHYFLQYKFSEQWQRLRQYAAQKGVQIIGDVPIYVPLESCDVWANRAEFLLSQDDKPLQVAGCPPDSYSKDGQLWGNPVYRWDRMKESGYRWWLQRLEAAAMRYDAVRLDHFRGFESYWAVPAGSKTARNGAWYPGPGLDLLRQIRKHLPQTRFLAEDLGFMTPAVRKMQLESGFAGMKVLQFAFDPLHPSEYLPHRYERHCVCYTGTHDNMTLRQWLAEAPPEELAFARDYLGLHEQEGDDWGIIRGGMSSVAELFIAQMQDYLQLGSEARMNTPGTVGPENWSWRAASGSFTPELAKQIARLTVRYERDAREKTSTSGGEP